MIDNHNDQTLDTQIEEDDTPDEDMHLFVYGNLTIRDADSGEILVNKSF